MSVEDKLESVTRQVIDDFSRTVMKSAKHALADNENPLRANFFATAMRILFEHTLHSLAPDEEVKACTWFKPEPDTEGRPTRPQRITYAIQGGLDPHFVATDLQVDVKPLFRRLKSAIQELSKHVHGRADTLISEADAQETFMLEMLNDFSEMMSVYEDCRRQILSPIEERVSNEAVDALMEETIQSIDELATHHSIEEVYVDHTEVAAITHDRIVYAVEGTIAVVLQWGSNSDLRNDMGAESEQNFPFTCRIEVPIDDPQNFRNGDITYSVKTRDWYGLDEEDA